MHLLPPQVRVLGASLIVSLGQSSLFGSSSGIEDLSGEIMHLWITIFRPPLSSMGSPSESSLFIVWEHGCVVVVAMLLPEVVNKFVDHGISLLLTNQGSSHPGSHAIVGEPFYKASCQMNL